MENLKENLYLKQASSLYRVLLKTTDRENNIQRVLCIQSSVVDDVTSNLPLRFSSTMDGGTQCGFLSREAAEQAIGKIRHNPNLIASGIPNENYELLVNHGRGTSRRQYVDVNTNLGKVLIRQETLDMVTSGRSLHKQIVSPTSRDPEHPKMKRVVDYRKNDPKAMKAIKDKTSKLIEIPDDIKNFPWRDLKAFIIDQEIINYYNRSLPSCLPKLVEKAPKVLSDFNNKLSQVINFLKESKQNNVTWDRNSFESVCPEEIQTLLDEAEHIYAPLYLTKYSVDREFEGACQNLLYPSICKFNSYTGYMQNRYWTLKVIKLEESFDTLIDMLQNAIDESPTNLEKLKMLSEQVKIKVTDRLPFAENGIHKHQGGFAAGYVYGTGKSSDGILYVRSLSTVSTGWVTMYSRSRDLDWFLQKINSIEPLNFDKIYNSCELTLNELYTSGLSDEVTKYLRRIIKEYEGEHYMNSKFKFESLLEAIEKHQLDTSCYYVQCVNDDSYLCLGSYNRPETAFNVNFKTGQGVGMGRNQKIQFLTRQEAVDFIDRVNFGFEVVPVRSRSTGQPGIKVPIYVEGRRELVWVNEIVFNSLSPSVAEKVMTTCPELRPSNKFDSISINRVMPNNVHFSQTSEASNTMYRVIITHNSRRQGDENNRHSYIRILTLEWHDNGRFEPHLSFTYITPEHEYAYARTKALFMSEEDARRAAEESLQALGHQPVEEWDGYINTYEIEIVPANDIQIGSPIHGMKANPNSSTFWFLTERQECEEGVNYRATLPQGLGSYVKTNGMSPWDPRHPQSFNYIVPNDRFRFE